MPRGRKRVAAPGGSARQVQLDMYPLLKKPLEQIGTYIDVPGNYWQGRMSAEEKETNYRCLVRDHSAMAPLTPTRKGECFQLQEMGVTGTGSLEHGDASGEIFWMEYPLPYLQFYYAMHPELKPNAPARTPAAPADVVDLDDDKSERTSPDVLPQFPHLRLSKAPVMDNFSIVSDTLVDAGPKNGQFAARFECMLVEGDGRACGKTRLIYHRRGRAVSTTNLINHVRERAAVCTVHKAALQKIEAASTNFIEIDGETVAVHTFRDAFCHHVDLMWLQAIGMSFNMTKRDEFRGYVRGYEARAAFPDHGTLHKLVDTVHTLQKNTRVRKITLKKKLFKGQPFCGVQIDMWWCTETQTAYGCLSMTTIEEPTSQSPPAQLWVASEILAFEVFPYHSKTGEAIKDWVVATLAADNLAHDDISGITPDGAADGQCGFRLIPDLSEKVDTCQLHVIQRAVLNSVGLAGTVTKNAHAKRTLKKNNRVVMLSRQSGAFGKAITQAQLAAGVPAHKVISPEPTATTRWGNQFVQLSKNCTLRPAIDPALEKYKRDNKGNKEAIVEANESEQGSKIGTAVAANEIGLNSEEWEDTQELEVFLSYPFDIKETIEKRGHCTGAQGLALLHDLKSNFCHVQRSLSVKALPTGLALADRERGSDDKPADELGMSVSTGREVLQQELQARAFDLRPSNTRLVQCYMSKQVPASVYLTDAQLALAKTLYLQKLRIAHEISRSVPKRSSPPRAAKKPKLSAGGMLFRGSSGLAVDESSPAPPAQGTPGDDSFDPVVDEMRRWEALATEHYSPFIAEDGLLNEFAMLWAMRERFPLHLIVFKQTACHLPHEANIETYFSRAGLLADTHMNAEYLGKLTSIAVNRKVYQPSTEEIKLEYFTKEAPELDLTTPKNSPSKGGSSSAGCSSDPLSAPDA